jgi:exopolysaccharide biosynthesis polyprenyl glycosylphosphotransferase
MILKLAVLELVSLVAAACGTVLASTRLLPNQWPDVAILLTKTLAVALCCIVSFYYNDLYDFRIVRTFGDFAARLFQAFGVAFILLAVPYALFPAIRISADLFLTSLIVMLAVLLPLRALLYVAIAQKPFTERVLILGTTPLASAIVELMRSTPYSGYEILVVAENGSTPVGFSPVESLVGSLDCLGKILEEVQPYRIIIALAERRARLPVRDLLEARVRGCIVEDGVNVYERLTGKLAIETLTPSTLIFSGDFRKSRLDLAAGRCISLLVSVIGLILCSPLIALVALAIKIDSRGSVFFIQDRVGMAARRFRLFKFRTMHIANGPTSEWAGDNATRITRVGKWLRKYRLDELPQFFNVMRGDMNLVGPRPHPVSNFELFNEHIPYYWLRTKVRPGITGWAQVRYQYANNLDEETEKMRYDLYYIKHLSVAFDLRILFDTVKTVLFGSQSFEVDGPPVAATSTTASTGGALEAAK